MKILSLIFLFALPAEAKMFCESYKPAEAFVKVEKSVQSELSILANKKLIAEQADAMFSKLITAKSPILISWMKKRELEEKSEDEIIKAWRQYYAVNFVLTKYPHADSQINVEVERVVDGLLTEHLSKAAVERLEALFAKAKSASLERIQALAVPQKAELLARVRAIKLYWPKSLKSARNNSLPLDLIDWGIAYDPVPNEINIGLRALSYSNDETYLSVFAHEIGHSFDSCRWQAFFTGPWPFEKIGECLRSDKSVKAKKRDDSALDKFVKEGRVSKDTAAGLRANPTCNRLIYPPPGIQADQLPESFADWFSAEVVARIGAIKIDQLRQDLCEPKSRNTGSSYPSNDDRLNLIYFAQPVLKAKRGEGSNASRGQYCAL